ncbi:MAG: Nramp family divalent metal transporter [Bacteroidia bacterium]
MKFLRGLGPGILIAVGYMDPGNWATDLEAGSRYGYALLWVVAVSSLAAIFFQNLAVRVGLVFQSDLIGLGYRFFRKPVARFLTLTALGAVWATDVAEVLGFALGLKLLFGIPLFIGVGLSVLEAFVVLTLTYKRVGALELIVGLLTLGIFGGFVYEMLLIGPQMHAVIQGFIPTGQIFMDPYVLYLSLGIVGATLMPHNLYLHSYLVIGRFSGTHEAQLQKAQKDTWLNLGMAFFINAALLILAAEVFYPEYEAGSIERAHELLAPLLGAKVASVVFALLLLLSGHNATLTSTLTGQTIWNYLLPQKLSPFAQGMLVRILTLLPAMLALYVWGENNLSGILVLSQVILSLQLSFVVLPLVYFASRLPAHKLSTYSLRGAWALGILLLSLNVYLLLQVP